MNMQKALLLVLLCFSVALTGCGKSDSGSVHDIQEDTAIVSPTTDGADTTAAGEDKTLPPMRERDSIQDDFHNIVVEDTFSEVKAWVSDGETAYLLIGTLKDSDAAGELSTQMIVDLLTLDDDSNIPNLDMGSASSGDFFVLVGANNASNIVDAFSDIVASQPELTIDGIYTQLTAE